MIREHDGINYLLEPCPFCGLDKALFTNCQEVEACADYKRCADSHYFAVVCSCGDKGCGASTGFWPTREEAAKHWNQRTGGFQLEELLRLIEKNTCGVIAANGRFHGAADSDRREPVQEP